LAYWLLLFLSPQALIWEYDIAANYSEPTDGQALGPSVPPSLPNEGEQQRRNSLVESACSRECLAKGKEGKGKCTNGTRKPHCSRSCSVGTEAHSHLAAHNRTEKRRGGRGRGSCLEIRGAGGGLPVQVFKILKRKIEQLGLGFYLVFVFSFFSFFSIWGSNQCFFLLCNGISICLGKRKKINDPAGKVVQILGRASSLSPRGKC